MKSVDIQKHILSTYFTLRVGMGTLALMLPLLLWWGGYWFAGLELKQSMSAYYHTVMRDGFVGFLFAIGAFLYLYKGYSNEEDNALNAAGVLVIGVALFPSTPPGEPRSTLAYIHGICAVSFFISIAYVCIFRARDTLELLESDSMKKIYNTIYRCLGFLMVVLPLLAVITSLINDQPMVFWVEFSAVWVFGIYWIIKSYEIHSIGLEKSLEQYYRLAPRLKGFRK